MVSKQHCSVCGFLMMYTVQDEKVMYACVNEHDARLKDESNLGPNLDILLQWLKNSGNKKDPS